MLRGSAMTMYHSNLHSCLLSWTITKQLKWTWQIQPSEVIDHLAALGSVRPYLKKQTKFKDGVQVSWSVLSIFVQTVYYHATATKLFCIINL